MRLAGTKLAANHQYRGFGDQLYDLSGERPSLDLNFASTKSLVDSATSTTPVTFTRASSGTYVDSQGVIRTATTNLLLRSEEFDDAVWVKVGGSITANVMTAPDGQTTADLYVENTNTVQHDVRVTSPTLTDGTPYTMSVYGKTNGRLLQIIFPLNTAGHGAIFDLSNGTFTLVGNTVTASIQSVGNGWYRCICTATKAGGTGTNSLRILTNNGTTNSYTGDGTSGIYLWGAQLEQSSTVGEYIPTTSTINSAPRFDHNPTTGESLGLLVEESRTNYILYSEAILSNAVSGPNRTITENAEVSPDGATTAASVTATGTDPYVVINTATGVPAGTYTLSVYLKGHPSNSSQECKLRIQDAGSGLQTSAAFTITTDWQRYNFTVTTTGNLQNVRLDIPDVAVSGDIVYVWGLQIEAGSFPTSYIPTEGTTVTRAADVASISGSNFSSWYRQDEGTVFVDARTNATHGGFNTFPRLSTLSDGTNNNAIENYLRVLSSYTDAGYRVATGGVAQAQYDTNNERNGQKQSVAYAANNFAFTVGGTIQNTDTSGSVPVIAQLRIGARGDGSAASNGTIRRLTYWPQRLPNSTLQQITQ